MWIDEGGGRVIGGNNNFCRRFAPIVFGAVPRIVFQLCVISEHKALSPRSRRVEFVVRRRVAGNKLRIYFVVKMISRSLALGADVRVI